MDVANFYGKTLERRVSCFGQGSEALGEVKLFRNIATQHFDFSQRCFKVFVLFNNLLISAISLADNTTE